MADLALQIGGATDSHLLYVFPACIYMYIMGDVEMNREDSIYVKKCLSEHSCCPHLLGSNVSRFVT